MHQKKCSNLDCLSFGPFYKDKNQADGLTKRCKACHSPKKDKTRREINNESVRLSFLRGKKRYANASGVVLAYNAKRRAERLRACPKWLSEADKEKIKSLYKLAKSRKTANGEKYHVDHIIPLKGKTVSGLHVPWNLQILPASMNISKGNRV